MRNRFDQAPFKGPTPSRLGSATARAELAQFLRNRRARIRPADVGLPQGTRRRALGLRREEVARLADVGVSWYTPVHASLCVHRRSAELGSIAHGLTPHS